MIPKRDLELKGQVEIIERIANIKKQIDKLERIWEPRDFNAYHNKLKRLNERKRSLRRKINDIKS